jgi:hypothetical protein
LPAEAPIPNELRCLAKERGRPDDLLRRILATRAIRPTRPGYLPCGAELIDRTDAGRDRGLFRPYWLGFFEDILDEGFWGERRPWWHPVYCWSDHPVLEQSGRSVACAGL